MCGDMKLIAKQIKTTLINTELSRSIINNGGDDEPDNILIKNVSQNNFRVNAPHENDSR